MVTGVELWLGDRFTLDAAASEANALADRFISHEEDALTHVPWPGEPGVAWLNPPYSKQGGGQLAWAERAHLASVRGWTVALLIPAAPTTRCGVFCGLNADEILYTAGRIGFIDPTTGRPIRNNPLGSQVVVFRPHTSRQGPVPGRVRVVYGWTP